MEILIVGFGGFLGAIARFLVTKFSTKIFGNYLPYGTLLVNISGSFLLGLFYALIANKLFASHHPRVFIGVGFMGAFTTFSSFSVETLNLAKNGNYALALANVALNVVLSLSAAYAGMALAKAV